MIILPMTSLGDVISGIKCLAKVLLQHQRSLLLLSGRLRTSFTEAWTVRSSKETYVIVSIMMLFYVIHAIMQVTDVYLCKRKKKTPFYIICIPCYPTIISSVYPTKPSHLYGISIDLVAKGIQRVYSVGKGKSMEMRLPIECTQWDYHLFPLISHCIYLGKLQYYTTLKEGYIGIIPLTNIY